eukprot:3697617-Rhodomonas_salina.6
MSVLESTHKDRRRIGDQVWVRARHLHCRLPSLVHQRQQRPTPLTPPPKCTSTTRSDCDGISQTLSMIMMLRASTDGRLSQMESS